MMFGQNLEMRAARTVRRAFTLIEILSVVVILGIVSAIVVPQISSRDDLQAASTARAIMADLLYAQNRAITTQQMQYVSFDTVNQQYGLYSSMSPLTALTQPVDHTAYVMTFNGSGPNTVGNATLTSATFGSGETTVAFDATGVPYSYDTGSRTTTELTSAGTVVVTSGNYSVTVTVEPNTGDISVQ
jgi:prepilin-type N-terminal cleavage/methylation domain-containing protein